MATSDESTLLSIRRGLESGTGLDLSPMAVKGKSAVRKKTEGILETDYRQNFAVDVDRILHSLAYTRYIDKTQVFSFVHNDHITHRVLHVQLVSKIARTIGRYLRLNEDLIEAIALGHDIGHPPFGHSGERFLSDLCREHGGDFFLHNIQSIQFLDQVERKGVGWNLTLQVLDGILCHDGEVHQSGIQPDKGRTFEDFDRLMDQKKTNPAMSLTPMSLEGCVVRMADTIAYIGRDIEDAIRLGLLKREELPARSVKVLGETNGTMVYRLVTDLLRNSMNQPFVAFGTETAEALGLLKRFNYERIYRHPLVTHGMDEVENLYRILFERFLTDLKSGNSASVIYSAFLKGMQPTYIESHTPYEIVRDFIAGMTDGFFLNQCPDHLRPKFIEV
jgi:dGTPase